MGQGRIPQLCAGVFFDFLQTTAKSRRVIVDGEYKRTNNKSDRLGDANIMGGFIEMITGENPDPDGERLNSEVTSFRKCDKNGTINLPFDEDNDPTNCISSFLNSFEYGYEKLINRAIKFRAEYINIENDGQLSRFAEAILGIIKHDDISEDAVFYVKDNKTPVLYDDLIRTESIVLEPFILGIMKWIYDSGRKNDVEKGRYKDWMVRNASGRWVLRKDIIFSEGISHVDVKHAEKVVVKDKSIPVESYSDSYDVPPLEDQNEVRMNSATQYNTIQNARVISVSGNGIYVERIDHVDTLNDIRDKK